MICPKCGARKNTSFPHTLRNRADKTTIYRTRVCNECLETWSTMETADNAVPIYGLPVVFTARFDTCVMRSRANDAGATIKTREEMLPAQRDRYRQEDGIKKPGP